MRGITWKAAVAAASFTVGAVALAQGSGNAGMTSTTDRSATSGSSGSSSGDQAASSSGAGQAGGKLDKKLAEATQKLHAANEGEVQTAQLAEQSAQSPEVKQFARQLASEHQKNDAQLQQIAQGMGAELQGKDYQKQQKDAQDDLKKLQGKTGAEFDKAYVKMMVDDHKKNLKDVEKAAKDAHQHHQAQLASFLDQTRSHLQAHLQRAQQLEKSVGQGGASARSGSPSSSQGMGSSATDTSGTGSSRSSGTGTSGTRSSSGSDTGTSR